MTNLIATDSQKLEIDSPLVDLFELELPVSVNGSSRLYFHPGVDSNYDNIEVAISKSGTGESATFTYQEYTPLPMNIDGLELNAQGASARPTLTMANVTSILGDALGHLKFNDLIGQKVTRRQTLEKYLKGGSANDFPVIEFSKQTYVIDRIANENNILVSFELAISYDLENVTLPRRIIVGKYCSWLYQGETLKNHGGCRWPLDGKISQIESGSSTLRDHHFYFNVNDEPIVTEAYITSLGTITWSSSTSYTTGVTATAAVNGATTNTTALALDGNQGTIDVGMVVTGTGISGTVTVTTVTDQNNLVLSSAQSLANDVILNFMPNSYVLHEGQNYLALFENTNKDPKTTSGFWKKVHTYTEHNTTNTNYSVGDIVRFSLTINSKAVNTVWRCLRAHNSNTANTDPALISPFWVREDACSKTLQGCKCRFQATAATSTVNNSGPSSVKLTSKILPFGGFPGTNKY